MLESLRKYADWYIVDEMIPYQKEKIDNAICFFADEHYKRTRKPLHQTFLYKYLAFLDFTSLKETGRPVLGLEYQAMQYGPVPTAIYRQKEALHTALYTFIKCENTFTVRSKKQPDLEYFSKYEIKLMQRLIEIFADRYVSTNLISDASHEEIVAWKKTWAKKHNAMIDPALTFEDNLPTKHDTELSFQEECFLTHKAVEGR